MLDLSGVHGRYVLWSLNQMLQSSPPAMQLHYPMWYTSCLATVMCYYVGPALYPFFARPGSRDLTDQVHTPPHFPAHTTSVHGPLRFSPDGAVQVYHTLVAPCNLHVLAAVTERHWYLSALPPSGHTAHYILATNLVTVCAGSLRHTEPCLVCLVTRVQSPLLGMIVWPCHHSSPYGGTTTPPVKHFPYAELPLLQ